MSWQRIGKRVLISILVLRGTYSLIMIDSAQLWQCCRSWVYTAPPRPAISSSWQEPIPDQKFVVDATQNNGEVFGQLLTMYAFAHAQDLEFTLLTQADKPRRAQIFVTKHTTNGKHVTGISVLNIQHIHTTTSSPTFAYFATP